MFGTRSSLLSMENEALGGDAPNPEIAGQVADVVADNEAVTEDVQDGAAIIQDQVALEDAVEEIQGMEQIQDQVQESVDSGEGLSEDAGQMLEVAVERAAKRIGVAPSRRLSKENFKTGSKLSATRLSLEGIKETVVAAWEAVKNFFKGLWVKIKDFFARIFTNLPKLRKQIIAMRDRAYGIKGSEKKADKIKTAAGSFSHDGKADLKTAEAVIENYTGLVGAIPEAFKSFGTEVAAIVSSVKGSGKADFNNLTSSFLKPLESIKGVAEVTGSKPTEIGNLRFTGKQFGPFLNGQLILIGSVNHKDTKDADKADAAEPHFAMHPQKQTAPAEIEALSSKQVQELADKLLGLLDAAEGVDRKKNVIESALNSAVKGAEEVIKAAQGGLSEDAGASEQRKFLSESRSWLMKASAVANRLVVMAPAMSAQTIKAGLAYGNASLSNIKSA